jgi:hypothetical protein
MEQELKPKLQVSKEQVLGIVRHALTMVGGGFIASGVLTEGELFEGIGYIIGTIGFIWSVIKNRS